MNSIDMTMNLAILSFVLVGAAGIYEILNSRYEYQGISTAITKTFLAVLFHGLFYAGMMSGAWTKMGLWILTL